MSSDNYPPGFDEHLLDADVDPSFEDKEDDPYEPDVDEDFDVEEVEEKDFLSILTDD